MMDKYRTKNLRKNETPKEIYVYAWFLLWLKVGAAWIIKEYPAIKSITITKNKAMN